jgi:hypothetical protein
MNLGCLLRVRVSEVTIRILSGLICGVLEAKEEWYKRFYDIPIPL